MSDARPTSCVSAPASNPRPFREPHWKKGGNAGTSSAVFGNDGAKPDVVSRDFTDEESAPERSLADVCVKSRKRNVKRDRKSQLDGTGVGEKNFAIEVCGGRT